MIEDLTDPRRSEPPYARSERETLVAWLEFHRTTLLLKCEGLDDDARKRRPIPTSKLSLHGLIRHAAEGERIWFRRNVAEEPVGLIWANPPGEDRELFPLDDADWETDLAIWHAECDASRAVAAARELDDLGTRHGEPCSLRWAYVHAIEEYARHNGHADLIRELIDGSVGW
jgi:uncharacterized protein DUF664